MLTFDFLLNKVLETVDTVYEYYFTEGKKNSLILMHAHKILLHNNNMFNLIKNSRDTILRHRKDNYRHAVKCVGRTHMILVIPYKSN